jgi:Ca2+-binding RTX toxin-like protein
MVRLRGGDKVDIFRGTDVPDVYFGEGGNDILRGGAGNDKCFGDEGNDLVDGGLGNDTVKGGAGNDRLYGGLGDDTIDGGAGDDRIYGGSGDDSINGGAGNDLIRAGAGDDSVRGGSGSDRLYGNSGDDNLDGGSGNDSLYGGLGNDFVSGGTGDDRMRGGSGDDTLDWDDGEGNDVISGDLGRDIVEVNGSVLKGDNFVLSKLSDGRALFERVGLDGQPVDLFNLKVDTSEVFDVFGEGGNDTFIVKDLTGTGVELVQFTGGDGNDILDARATSTRVVANGGEGNDILIGGTGTIVGANGAVTGDNLTGGAGKDTFQFSTDPFAGGTPGQNLNRPDVITDYEIGQDVLAFDKQQTGINVINFQKGNSAQLSGNNNVLVLTDGFANAGQAAAAIRDNNNITSGKGLFVYFNTTLGFSRVVYSQDLANGGNFSVQGNLINQTNINNQANFSTADFTLV